MNKKQSLEKAISIAGSQEKLGSISGFTQAAISKMLNRDGMASIKAAVRFEEALGGKITRYQFRPDFFGNPPQQTGPQ